MRRRTVTKDINDGRVLCWVCDRVSGDIFHEGDQYFIDIELRIVFILSVYMASLLQVTMVG